MPEHQDVYYAFVEENREHLSEWLPWVQDCQHKDYVKVLIEMSLEGLKDQLYNALIYYRGELAGRIGFNQVDVKKKSGCISFHLGRKFVGKGIMFHCCLQMLKVGFENLALNSVCVRVNVDNLRGIALLERIGFMKCQRLYAAEILRGQYCDNYLYTMSRKTNSKIMNNYEA